MGYSGRINERKPVVIKSEAEDQDSVSDFFGILCNVLGDAAFIVAMAAVTVDRLLYGFGYSP